MGCFENGISDAGSYYSIALSVFLIMHNVIALNRLIKLQHLFAEQGTDSDQHFWTAKVDFEVDLPSEKNGEDP